MGNLWNLLELIFYGYPAVPEIGNCSESIENSLLVYQGHDDDINGHQLKIFAICSFKVGSRYQNLHSVTLISNRPQNATCIVRRGIVGRRENHHIYA